MTLSCVSSWPTTVLGTDNELKIFVRKTNKYQIGRMTNDKRKAMKIFWGEGKVDLGRVVIAERLELRRWH